MITNQGLTDILYDLWTYALVSGYGANIMITDQGLTDIPLHMRRGVTLPMRVAGANTATTRRRQDFMLLVPVGVDGTVSGELYPDEGDPNGVAEHFPHHLHVPEGTTRDGRGSSATTRRSNLRYIVLLQAGMPLTNVTVNAPLTRSDESGPGITEPPPAADINLAGMTELLGEIDLGTASEAEHSIRWLTVQRELGLPRTVAFGTYPASTRYTSGTSKHRKW